MLAFDFYNPTRIFFGQDRLDVIDKFVPPEAKVLITFGRSSATRYGVIDKVKAQLKGRKIVEFGGIEPNPRYETLVKAVDVVRRENIDFILAVGGGSVIDGTKFICLASHYDGDARNLLRFGFDLITTDVVKHFIPFGAVLTLPATGSEMNKGAAVTYDDGKFTVMSEMMFPTFSILDPTYTLTLPRSQVANGVVDAYSHVAEQYITYPLDAKVQDRIAEGLLQTLIEIGATTVNEPANVDARANLVWSASMALSGIIGAGVPQDWAAHMIGMELTTLYGIDHGQTLAILYPAMLEVRKEKKRSKLLQYAERVWHLDVGTDEDKIDLAIQRTREFFESLGVRTRLSQYGIASDNIPVVIKKLETHGMTALSETQDLDLEFSKMILEKAL